jgi:lipopolysaccharide biosynthesis glycosyltransferase
MESSKQNRIPLCVLFDDAYLYPFLIAIYSAALNKKESFSLVIGDTGWNLDSNSKKIIEKFCSILKISFEWFNIPLDGSYNRSFAHVPPLAAGRLFFLDLMEGPFVYSDVDVLFLIGWDEILYEPLLTGQNVASVVLQGDSSWLRKINQDRFDRGVPPNQAMVENEDGYFGAGLLVVDPKLWREFGFDTQWKIIYKERFEELGLWILEQDILNYLLKGFTENLSVAYNYPATWSPKPRSYKTYLPDEALPIKILQFQGNAKPWNYSKQSRLNLFLKTQEFFKKTTGSVQESSYFLTMQYWYFENLFWEWAFQQENGFFDELQTIFSTIKQVDF